MKLLIALAIAVLCGTVLAQSPTSRPSAVIAAASKPALPFTIGYDTTRITGPLKADGTVDYLAALNVSAFKGVTKENNAAVLIAQAIGPEIFDAPVRAQGFKALGMEEPKGTFLKTDFADEKAFQFAQGNLWQAKDHPELAAWLKENEKPLSLLVQASNRSRFYMPVLAQSDDQGLFGTPLPQLARLKSGCKMLIVRANLATAEGRTADAWADIQAVYRLGELVNQSQHLIGRLVAIAFSSMADTGAQNLTTSGRLDSKTAKEFLLDTVKMGYGISVIPVIDNGERFCFLDTAERLSTGKESVLGQLAGTGPSDSSSKFDAFLESKVNEKRADVDWNVVLTDVNREYDELLAILRNKNLKQRKEQYAKWIEALNGLSASIPASMANPSPTQATSMMSKLLISILMPSLGKSQEIVERGEAKRALTVQSLALAAYKADKGRYPQKLDELVPAYLKSLPKDLFSGKEFVYKPSADGADYVLYSIGPNQIDDGGKYDGAKELDDIAVTTQPQK